jgi:hypothetical protein
MIPENDMKYFLWLIFSLIFYILLTEHRGTILVNHQLDVQILYF